MAAIELFYVNKGAEFSLFFDICSHEVAQRWTSYLSHSLRRGQKFPDWVSFRNYSETKTFFHRSFNSLIKQIHNCCEVENPCRLFSSLTLEEISVLAERLRQIDFEGFESLEIEAKCFSGQVEFAAKMPQVVGEISSGESVFFVNEGVQYPLGQEFHRQLDSSLEFGDIYISCINYAFSTYLCEKNRPYEPASLRCHEPSIGPHFYWHNTAKKVFFENDEALGDFEFWAKERGIEGVRNSVGFLKVAKLLKGHHFELLGGEVGLQRKVSESQLSDIQLHL